jgi:hypothetical protein
MNRSTSSARKRRHFLDSFTFSNSPRHHVHSLNFDAEHHREIFRFEQAGFLLLFIHGATIKQHLLFCRVNWAKWRNMNCPHCSGYLIHEPELLETPARVKCIVCGWMVYDPSFRKEETRYFPADSTDRRIENPGYDLYEPKSAACQLGISVSYLKDSVRNDPSAPIMGWGLIACNTPSLQSWWGSKKHQRG